MADASEIDNFGRPKSNSEPLHAPAPNENNINEIAKKLDKSRLTETDGFNSYDTYDITRRTPNLTRNRHHTGENRRTKSLYGVSPNCKFGPCGTILDSSDTSLYYRSCDFLSTGNVIYLCGGESRLPDIDKDDPVIQKPLSAITIYTSFLMVVSSCLTSVECSQYMLAINSSDVRNEVTHFWRNTGFCPPSPHQDAYKFDIGKDMLLNLALIGAVPHQGIDQVRIHWLLDLVAVKSLDNGITAFNFSKLDSMVNLLLINGLKPGFELMGNPSNFFSDFENETQIYLWRDLIYETAQNYILKYGVSEVMNWNFETWNEPDCRDFDKLKMSVQGFLNYYDACSEGLKKASPLLKFGGPGDGCDHSGHSKYSDALLDHVVKGNNYFTGKKDVRIDFLSYHRKGNGRSYKIIQDELSLLRTINQKYPSLTQKPFYNDEADPLVGWSKDEWWRADATYAAMVIKIIAQHQNMIKANSSLPINFSLLSNDNAFLSYYPYQFTQRTLTARFQMNITKYPYVRLVRKPVYSSMALLSLLGEKQLFIDLNVLDGTDIKVVGNDSNVGAVATVHIPEKSDIVDTWHLSVLIYSSNDTFKSNKVDTINCSLLLLDTKADLVLVEYSINNFIGNPYKVWSQYGYPAFPNLKQFHDIMKQEGPLRTKRAPVFVKDKFKSLHYFSSITLPQPGVVLVHICSKSLLSPNQPSDVIIYNITIGQILVTWSDIDVGTKCILRYDVEFSSLGEAGPYTKINIAFDSIVTAFVYAPMVLDLSDSLVFGYYRVRAVDYFDRVGPYSVPSKYPK